MRSALRNDPIVQDDVAALVARRRRGYSLEAAFYRDPALFDFDMASIFERHWIHVGVASEVPKPGYYITVEIGRFAGAMQGLIGRSSGILSRAPALGE